MMSFHYFKEKLSKIKHLIVIMEKNAGGDRMSTIFFDVDGTLLTTKHVVSSLTIETLHQLRNKGHELVIATGRNLGSLKHSGVLDQFDWDGYILNNGQVILNKNFELEYLEEMSSKSLHKIIETCEEEGIFCTFETMDEWYIIQEPNDIVRESHDFFNEPYPKQKVYDEKDQIVMVILYAPYGYSYDKFIAMEELNVKVGNSTYADVSKVGCHKMKGIEEYKKRFHVQHSIAFGDGSNDSDMLQGVDIGIAMGNGASCCKKASDFVTKSNDEEGITYACQHFSLI